MQTNIYNRLYIIKVDKLVLLIIYNRYLNIKRNKYEMRDFFIKTKRKKRRVRILVEHLIRQSPSQNLCYVEAVQCAPYLDINSHRFLFLHTIYT